MVISISMFAYELQQSLEVLLIHSRRVIGVNKEKLIKLELAWAK